MLEIQEQVREGDVLARDERMRRAIASSLFLSGSASGRATLRDQSLRHAGDRLRIS